MRKYTHTNSAKFSGRPALFWAFVVGFVVLPFVLMAQTGAPARPPVTIYEVCIQPDSMSAPRWIKLRSFSAHDVNLKGYSLHDRTNCVYRFEKDCLLKAGRSLVLYFYPENVRVESAPAGVQYSSGNSSCPYCINITNSSPFSAMAEPTASYWRKDIEYEDIAVKALKNLTLEQFDYISRLADEHRARYGITNVSRAVMMKNIAYYGYRESDEVALVDGEGRVTSFVGWGAGPHLQQPATSRWEKAAIETGLVFRREHIVSVGGRTMFEFPGMIIGRTGPDSQSFLGLPFGTPEDTQCKDPIQTLVLDVDNHTGEVRAGMVVRSSLDSWKCILEIAARPDFEKVVSTKKAVWPRGIWSLGPPPAYMSVPFSDEEIRALCKHDMLFYRARREFNDGASSAWTDGAKVVLPAKWLSAFGDTPQIVADGLIKARRKSGASRQDPAAEGEISR